MPVPVQRDPELTRTRLSEWLGARVVTIAVPDRAGFSAETLLVELRGERTEHIVVRVAPTGHQVYPESRFAEQVEVQRLLGERTDVPVPRVHRYEADSAVLSAPFVVMDRVAGRVPPDFPSYHREGWLAELPVEELERLWCNGLDALHRIHRLDVRELGLGFLDRPRYGAPGLVQHLNSYAWHLDFFSCAQTAVDHRPGRPAGRGARYGTR